MKVAVATVNGKVCEHFGNAPGFTFAQVSENAVENVEYIENPAAIVRCFRSLWQIMVWKR